MSSMKIMRLGQPQVCPFEFVFDAGFAEKSLTSRMLLGEVRPLRIGDWKVGQVAPPSTAKKSNLEITSSGREA
jgi:hypothetical protein